MSQQHTPAEDAGLSSETLSRRAMFEGLVYNESGERAEVVYVGGTAHYAVPDQGFLRHVEAHLVDDVVIAQMKDQITSMKDEVIVGILEMLGKDDLFTKAAVDASIRNLDHSIRQTDPGQWGPMLQLLGFRVVVDLHGRVVEVLYPQATDSEE